MSDRKCHFCGYDLTFTNYPYYSLRKAVKPPFSHKRWVDYAVACESCGDKPENFKYLSVDPWRD